MADARTRDDGCCHVGNDWVGAGDRKCDANWIRAEQPLGPTGWRDRRHGIGQGDADEPVFGGPVGVITGRTEMAAVAYCNGAKSELLGDADSYIDGATARH